MLFFKIILVLIYFGVAFLFGRGAFERDELKRPGILVTLLLVFVAFLFGMTAIGQVPAGNRGVVLRFGAVTGRVLSEGIYLITPGVESVQLMDVQVHAHKADATAASRDLQDVTTQITLNFRLDPAAVDTIYRDLRNDYELRIIQPAVQEAVKAATAAYDAEQLIQERAKVRTQMEDALVTRLGKHGILVDAMSITNFNFSKDFSAAIEQKVVAAQTALRAENDLRRIKVEAEQRIATATAEAQAIKIQAEAIQSQGGAAYVNLKAIEKWDGRLPTWTGGGGVPFVQVVPPQAG